MKKVNTSEVEERDFESPKGVYAMHDINLSHALGRDADSTDLNERHPFDVEICRIPAGKKMCPYHSHSAQWEFYHVISGQGSVRDAEGHTPVTAGDAFLFKPGEAHQIINDSDADLVFYIVANYPAGRVRSWWGQLSPRCSTGEPAGTTSFTGAQLPGHCRC
jgi:uncharacterized cupin superfamily protein